LIPAIGVLVIPNSSFSTSHESKPYTSLDLKVNDAKAFSSTETVTKLHLVDIPYLQSLFLTYLMPASMISSSYYAKTSL